MGLASGASLFPQNAVWLVYKETPVHPSYDPLRLSFYQRGSKQTWRPSPSQTKVTNSDLCFSTSSTYFHTQNISHKPIPTQPSYMTLTPHPPLFHPPSPTGCHLSANLSRCIANPTRSFIILFFTLLFFVSSSSSSCLPSLGGWTVSVWGGGFVFSHRFCQSRPGRRLPGWHVASGLQWLETSRSLSPSWSSLLLFSVFIFFFFFARYRSFHPPPPFIVFLPSLPNALRCPCRRSFGSLFSSDCRCFHFCGDVNRPFYTDFFISREKHSKMSRLLRN